MIKKSIIVFFVALLFTGCVERGSNVPLKVEENHIKKHLDKKDHIPVLVLKNSREDNLKKSVSGSLILIIGLILLL